MTQARHLNEKTSTRFLIVKETREISRGRNPRTGSDYTMWQIIATKPDGTPIDQNLRSFEDLPRGEVLEVSVTPFVSQQWGTSYTIARKDKSKLHSDVDELKQRIERIEAHLGLGPNSSPQQGPPPPPPQSTTTAPPAPPTLAERPPPGDGDIPF